MKLTSKRKQLRIVRRVRDEGDTFYRIVIRNEKFWIAKKLYQQLPLGLDFTITQFGLAFKEDKKDQLAFVIFPISSYWSNYDDKTRD